MSQTKHTFVAGPALSGIVATVAKQIGSQTFSADVATLPDSAIAYLVQYGFAQSIGDTKALSALEKAKQGEKAGVFPEGFSKTLETNNAAAAMSAFFAANEGSKAAYDEWEGTFLSTRAQARLDDIISGDMVFGSSERLSPEEKDRREICTNMLRTALEGQGKKLPKVAEDLNRMLAFVYEKKQAEVDKEIARRAKVRAASADLDLSSFT